MLMRTWLRAPIVILSAAALAALPCCSAQVVEEHADQDSTSGAGGHGGDGSVTTGSVTTGSGGSGAGPSSGACKPGDAPVALSSAENHPFALAIDAEFVYFTTSPSNTCVPDAAVKRVSKHGGAPEIIGKAMYPVLGLAVDGDTLYWSDDPVSPCTDPADPGHTIVAAPKAGGKPSMFPFSGQLKPTEDIALDATDVYWVSADMGSVRRAAKTGGKPEVLFNGGDTPIALAIDGANVYWAGGSGVAREPKAGGGVSSLAPFPSLGGLGGLGVDGGFVYFGLFQLCQGADCTLIGTIVRVPIGGGNMIQIASTVDKQPVRLALDDKNVYWTASDALPPGQLPLGAVMRAPTSSGKAEQIYGGQTPHGIAVDDTCVYWTDAGDGTVMKAPK